jgi:hypothetical protein
LKIKEIKNENSLEREIGGGGVLEGLPYIPENE